LGLIDTTSNRAVLAEGCTGAWARTTDDVNSSDRTVVRMSFSGEGFERLERLERLDDYPIAIKSNCS
jgi:hypothetical protein